MVVFFILTTYLLSLINILFNPHLTQTLITKLPELKKQEEYNNHHHQVSKKKRNKNSKAYHERQIEKQEREKDHQQGMQAKKKLPCKFYINGCCYKVGGWEGSLVVSKVNVMLS